MSHDEMSSAYPYTVELYVENDGSSPVSRWILEELTPSEGRVVTAAMRELLAALGNDVCRTEFGKNLGGGITELRLRQSEEQLLRRVGKVVSGGAPEDDGVEILLRVFFHPHGSKRILVLHGYSKGKNTSKRHQQEQIGVAQRRLARWKARERTAQRQSKSSAKGRGRGACI